MLYNLAYLDLSVLFSTGLLLLLLHYYSAIP